MIFYVAKESNDKTNVGDSSEHEFYKKKDIREIINSLYDLNLVKMAWIEITYGLHFWDSL